MVTKKVLDTVTLQVIWLILNFCIYAIFVDLCVSFKGEGFQKPLWV